MFYQIFLLAQVKPCEIITYEHAIYELPHELPKDLTLFPPRYFGRNSHQGGG